ncbi:MAG: ABC transporter ATP-binding protein [Oscillospiraceae bacterium]|jgi:ATP-binding cassette subfamily B protein|nr:ABC transporter ATP-binding protein [Oscillospiraceae bacterium]
MKLKEHIHIFKRGFMLSMELDKRYTIYLVLETVLSSLTGYIPLYFSAKLIDALYGGEPLSVIVRYVLLTVGLVFVIKMLTAWISCFKETYENSFYRSQDWMFSEKAMKMAYVSIEDPEVSRQKHRIRRENQTGFNLYRMLYNMKELIANGTKIIASLALTASFFVLPSLSVWYKLALAAGFILTLAVSMQSVSKIAEMEQKFWGSCVDLNTVDRAFYDYIDNYSAGKDIRLYAMNDCLADEKMGIDMTYYRGFLKLSCSSALWTLPTEILKYAFQFGLYGVLIFAALSGGISVGDIAKYVACIILLMESVLNFTGGVQKIFVNNHYLKRFFEYFDIPNNMYKGTLTVEKRDDNDYNVEFKDVSFKYPNTDAYALHHVNVKFKIGEKLAVVGMNGSGKTTFIKLLCRLYDPTEGEILLNGVNIQKYDYDEYMSIFSVVFQDFQLFPFKLGEVVASSKQFDVDRVKECLNKANFGERLSAFPDRAETYLYKRYDKSGVEISGGEAQKIALARALYKDAPFIILDEPTAALDPVSEYEVYSNFNEIAGDRTAVYISHRLASCRFCDKIAVFHEGAVIQSGNHEELLADTGGKYYELWNAQAQYYTKP